MQESGASFHDAGLPATDTYSDTLPVRIPVIATLRGSPFIERNLVLESNGLKASGFRGTDRRIRGPDSRE